MIDKSLLKSGDILLFRAKSFWHFSPWFISWGQNVMGKNAVKGATYCHVAIVDEDTDYFLEARWPKSKRTKFDWQHLDREYTVELWRVKNETNEEAAKAVAWAQANVGEWYDLGLFFWGWIDKKHAEVCSTFVTKAWESAGKIFKQVKKVGLGTLITPDEVAGNTDLIERIK